MNATERLEADAAMTDLQYRTTLYDDLQADIERYEAAQGDIHQVNILHGQGFFAITDPDMLIKAETALTKMITAKKDEQASI